MLLSSAAVPFSIVFLSAYVLYLLPWTDASRQSTCRGFSLIARRVIGWAVG